LFFLLTDLVRISSLSELVEERIFDCVVFD